MSSKKPVIVAYGVNLSLPTCALYGTFQTFAGVPSGFLYVNSSGQNFGGNVVTVNKAADGALSIQLSGIITAGGKRLRGTGLVLTTPVAGKLPKISATVYDATGKLTYDSGLVSAAKGGYLNATAL